MQLCAALLAILCMGGSGWAAAEDQAADPVLTVGVTVPLSGNVSKYGTAIRNGILLAQQRHDPNHTVRFVFEDDSFLPRNTIAAVNKFIRQDHADALVVFGSGPALVAAPIAERRQIPMVALASSPEVVQGRSYVMKHFASVEKETAAVVGETARRGYASVAVVTTLQDAMLALRDKFLEQTKIPLVANEEVLPDDTDMRMVASKISAQQPAALYVLLMPGHIGIFCRQLRASGYQGELFGAHQFESPEEVTAAQGALTKAWFVSVNAVQDDTFAPAYQRRFGSPPGNVACNGYDVAKILIEAAQAPKLIKHLRSLQDFSGVMGSYGALPDGSFDVPVVLKRVTESGFEVISSKQLLPR